MNEGQSNLEYLTYTVTNAYLNSLKAFLTPNIPNSYTIGPSILEWFIAVGVDSTGLPSANLPTGDANITWYASNAI